MLKVNLYNTSLTVFSVAL